MGCGHKIVLSKDMSFGGHAFLEYMSFRMVMPCIRKCLVGGHVMVECMSSG